ncbi:SpoVR family protein [Desulfogranum mediterraneum]|uniref:SpoVR family protein n=1 Tax=Desulfogranum mediterraneum TaxID=160661 RepID=UPI0004254685|nr:SpoVR family protein [Desulfogranum mediterraneum]
MELISQHAKRIMEGCKERAREAGLSFQDESLEYIVTNRDLVELSPKVMIPTLYDYWVQDVEILKEKGRYELYPSNPYETVINTRPPISYYNDNNPDWLNVMIFYHVLGHMDFFQNNLFFRDTWNYDFTSKALSDKRLIAKLRSEKGHWVDYVIEFSLAIDNLVGYFNTLGELERNSRSQKQSLLDYYFDVFLQERSSFTVVSYVKEIERYNQHVRDDRARGGRLFLEEVKVRYPELETLHQKSQEQEGGPQRLDLLQFLMEQSEFLRRNENRWMLTVMEVIRSTSLYFQPQIRTKILNEGWASYWHETLFLSDDRISGHEVDFARVNAKVTSLPRVGLNPYALGMRLFYYLEEMADRGKLSFDYLRLTDREERRRFDSNLARGKQFIFSVRENYADSMFISQFIDQDFVDLHKLFVSGKRLNKERMTWQYYVKSRKAEHYKNMVLSSLYHPPSITISTTEDNTLRLDHLFEGKPLVTDFIGPTMMGIEYLWGGPVELFTSEVVIKKGEAKKKSDEAAEQVEWERILYTMNKKRLNRKSMNEVLTIW